MTQPKFAPIERADEVRPSYELETAPAWFAHRPGEYHHRNRPKVKGLGIPGPDQGYAIRLARGFSEKLQLEAGEYEDDVITAAVVIALRRAAQYGRAPVRVDIELALELFGFLSGAPVDLVAYRKALISGIGHDYRAQRQLAGQIPLSTLSLKPADVRMDLANWPALTGKLTPS